MPATAMEMGNQEPDRHAAAPDQPLNAALPLEYARPGTVKSEVPSWLAPLFAWMFGASMVLLMLYRQHYWHQRLLLLTTFILPPVLLWISVRRHPRHRLKPLIFTVCFSWAAIEAALRLSVIYNDPNFPRSRWRSELVAPAVEILIPLGIYAAFRLIYCGADCWRRRSRITPLPSHPAPPPPHQ